MSICDGRILLTSSSAPNAAKNGANEQKKTAFAYWGVLDGTFTALYPGWTSRLPGLAHEIQKRSRKNVLRDALSTCFEFVKSLHYLYCVFSNSDTRSTAIHPVSRNIRHKHMLLVPTCYPQVQTSGTQASYSRPSV
jgi:hypothetical protein